MLTHWRPGDAEDVRTYEVVARSAPDQPTASITATLSVDEISVWLGRAFKTVGRVATSQGARPMGPPFARFHAAARGRFRVEAGFPVDVVIRTEGKVQPSWLPGGPVATTIHEGPYEEMEPAYRALAAWVGSHGGELGGDPWENFLSDPNEDPDPARWRTEIVQPYRAADDDEPDPQPTTARTGG